ncbi:unnamed protein product [Ambrosiozyma monospora]|uniref:Unnamed protein product n=1 Tax=Ambrosiozyma monospora TaxID=43982 RepID=A0ACB5U3A0_AMBMO|nr:unnamed protein product [Ambrosiozyma monospora]
MLDHWIARIEALGSDCGGVDEYLVKLANVFALSNIETFASWFLTTGVLSNTTCKKTSEVLDSLLLEVRPHVIGLTDSFKFSDYFINSVLGAHNGDVYNNYLKTVKLHNDPTSTKAPYDGALQNLLNRDDVDAREKFERSEAVLKKLSN